MLHLLDETLEAFLRAVVPLPDDVEVTFATPDPDWSARPTVSLALWDVRPSMPAEADGSLPRVECRYSATVWAGSVREEHALLGDLLTALLRHRVIDPAHLRGVFASVRPLPMLRLRDGDGALPTPVPAGRLRPGLDLVVTVTVDAVLRATGGGPVLIHADEITAEEVEPVPADGRRRLPARRWSGRD